MDIKAAVIAFSQSEKIKTGLIWASQSIEINMGIPEKEKRGAQRIVAALLNMIANEIQVVMRMAPHDKWDRIMQHLDTALVMINSNVAHEAPFHLSKALSQVTSIGQQSMTILAENRLI